MHPDFYIRSMKKTDIPQLMIMKNSLRWNQIEQDWERFILLDPKGCFVAIKKKTQENNEEELVGSITTTKYDEDIAWIGMIIVKESYRSQGIGNALIQSSINYAKNLILKLDATDLGYPLYVKNGFNDEQKLIRFNIYRSPELIEKLELIHSKLKKEYEHIKIVSVQNTEINNICEYDEMTTNLKRSRVLTRLIKDNRTFTLVAINSFSEENSVNGYISGRHGHINFQIGPLASNNEEIAMLLLYNLILKIPQKCYNVDIFFRNKGFIQYMQQIGAQKHRNFRRMIRGHLNHEIYNQNEYVITGPEKG
jgi:GNAT superfamily N-acetyltransferase